MSSDKLKNWKQSIEIDYLSLYIKTWFAFLSSLKQLHPAVISQTGDGSLIRRYLDNLNLPNNFDSEIKDHVKKSFAMGKITIKRDLPNSFFGRFFSVNKNFIYQIPANIGHARFKIEYRNLLNGRKNPNLFIDFKSTQSQFFNKFKLHHFTLNIPISNLISANIYETRDDCVNHIMEAMKRLAYDHINTLPQLQAAGINARKANVDTLLTLISQQWRPNFRIDQLFQPLPVMGFPDSYDDSLHKIVVIKWFIRFSYDLRNILFHHIIDPFDENWLKLFRYTYLGLREIVNYNIEMINQDPIQTSDEEIA